MYNTTTRVRLMGVYDKQTKNKTYEYKQRNHHKNAIEGYATNTIGDELRIINRNGAMRTGETIRKVKEHSIGYSIETDDNIWRFLKIHW